MSFLGKLLLIDSDFEARMRLGDALRLRRWIVETAPNAKLGLDAATQGQPNIVITELALPDASGLHFSRSLRTCIEHDAVIVGVSVFGPEELEAARSAGFDEVFAKPVDLERLHRFLVASVGPEAAVPDRRRNR
jgi:DNA-binding response OmpR family regulator